MVRFPNSASTRSQNGRYGGGGGGKSGYDHSSRYDPTTMGRIADSDLDPHLDPDEELFGHARHSLDISHVGLTFGGGGSGGGSGGWGQNILCCPTVPHLESRLVRRCILFTLTAVAVVGASIAIGSTVVQKNADGMTPFGPNGGGDGSDSKSSTTTLSGSFTSPPQPPSDLATNICTRDAIGQPGGYAKCQAQCTQAECCFLPEGHWFSCSASTSKICEAYKSACGILEEDDSADMMTSSPSGPSITGTSSAASAAAAGSGGGSSTTVEVPPAPSDITDTCSTTNLATSEGYRACTHACAQARCCAEPIEICHVSNPQACNDYDVCSLLLHEGVAAPTSTSSAGSVKAVTPASHPDAISSQATTKCNTASLMDAQGVQDCREFCEPALCCFAPKGQQVTVDILDKASSGTTIEGCADTSNEAWCSQYASCGSLLHIEDADGFTTDEDAAAAVSEACKDSLSASCETICKPAECCFVDEDYCVNTGLGDVQCDHYAACYELYDIQSGTTAQQVLVPRPPSDLEVTCSNGRIASSPEAGQQCADACSVATCCVADIETCKVVNPSMCGAYEIHCGAIWQEDFRETTIPEPPADLETLCGGATVVDDKWGQCDDACRPAKCCDQDISVCKVTNPNLCLAYETHCSVVWGDAPQEITIPEAPLDLDRKCAGAMLSADRRGACDDACRPASCCDKDIAKCKVLNPDACEPYEVQCAQVWGDAYQEVTIPTAPAELVQVCQPSAVGKDYKRCSDLCYMAKCCSEDIEACRVLNPAACDAYEDPCSGFWGDSVTVPNAPAELQQVCTADAVLTLDGHNRCQDLCGEARCCNDPVGKCRVLNPEMCSEYEACSVLYTQSPEAAISSRENDGGVEVPPAPPGLDAMCSPPSLSSVRGYTDCEDKCSRARCCLEDPADCTVLNGEVCPDYEKPCTALYEFKTKGSNKPDDVYAMPEAEVDIMDLAEQVVDACSSNSLKDVQGRSHCEHLCNDRVCCFEPASNPESCAKELAQECLAFAACKILFEQS